MPTVEAFRRAPLVNPAFVPLSDAAVQAGGLFAAMVRQALNMADADAMSPLDAVLASKLGGYTDFPPVPDLEAAAGNLARNPYGFILSARAALMTASASQDKNAMLRLLSAMRAFLETLPTLPEDMLFSLGADALRVTGELYRRTGQSFLLTLLERLRFQLPDVAGMMHSFPFLKAFQPETDPGENAEYHHRMERLATGNLTADAMAMAAQLALYSGSGRDSAAPKAGLNALMRYHGAPNGAFLADPYLAGRDPARATDLPALCAQVEALADALTAMGDLTMAEQLELLMTNALPDALGDGGIRTPQPINRLPDDESCAVQSPLPEDTACLLRALYALRRVIWMAREADEVALLLPIPGGCLTRVNGVPLRLHCQVAGVLERTLTITVESKQPVPFTLLLRIPSYVAEAHLSMNGGKEQDAPPGSLLPLRRTFRNGDMAVLRFAIAPRLETGHRGSQSVLCGPHLMALSLPGGDAGWQYALVGDTPLTPGEENGLPCVYAHACDAPSWHAKNGFITPPPQGLPVTTGYELTLLPYAGTGGRIAVFPKAVRRA